MTDRLYYNDSYLTEFRANVIDAGPERTRVYLDRTAFYPSSGGQPFDRGTLGGRAVIEVIDEEDRIAHVIEQPIEGGSEVAGSIDWARRFDHMQQHTGQHLLSAVLLELFSIPTVSFHLGAQSSTIDVAVAELDSRQLLAVEERANSLVFENRPVTVEYGQASDDLGLRKATNRTGTIRLVTISGLDRSACGGTHVRATGEIGPVLLRKLDKMRGNVRIEFLCGLRAVRQARADYNGLSAVARIFGAPLEDTPTLALAQEEKLRDTEKQRKKTAADLAHMRGRRLYLEAVPDSAGLRWAVLRLPALTEDTRIEAQSFTVGEKSVFLAAGENPPSILLATSKDSGIVAGERLKPLLAASGGRGGGNAALAQGSVSSIKDLEFVIRTLTSA
ncbi:MAG TPA: hypothetical protein VKG25_12770 [Bryobacteraceae bacterium]|nr:hypothetical protein [Bryobacteraceae bacterium]